MHRSCVIFIQKCPLLLNTCARNQISYMPQRRPTQTTHGAPYVNIQKRHHGKSGWTVFGTYGKFDYERLCV